MNLKNLKVKSQSSARQICDSLPDKMTIEDLDEKKLSYKDMMALYLPSIDKFVKSLGSKFERLKHSIYIDHIDYAVPSWDIFNIPDRETYEEVRAEQERIRKQVKEFESSINEEILGHVDVDKSKYELHFEPIMAWINGNDIRFDFHKPSFWYEKIKTSTGDEKLDEVKELIESRHIFTQADVEEYLKDKKAFIKEYVKDYDLSLYEDLEPYDYKNFGKEYCNEYKKALRTYMEAIIKGKIELN